MPKDIETINQILADYEVALGQRINMDKLVITLSLDVDGQCKRTVLSILGHSNVQSHDRYIGFSTVVRCNKRKTFEDIKE